jgi:DNA-binding LytR/AlgR family response regulator
MKYRCVIVEDEPIARDLLRSYIARVDHLDVVGQFGDAVAAGSFLRSNPVDLVFLDIKLPGMTGIDLLRNLPKKPRVVIISAYRDFAIDAYDLDVIDYLLKPVTFERFMKAMDKVAAGRDKADQAGQSNERFLYVKGNKQLQKVYLDQILFLESQRDYLRIRLTGQREVTTRQTITYYEELLPAQKFVRVHRSFLVAIDKITGIESTVLCVGDARIPVGRHYKPAVSARLGELTKK